MSKYEKYISPDGAPEMPEDKRGEEQINLIDQSEQQGKCSFINLAVLTLTLIFCAMIVFVLRENDYSSLNETRKLDKKSFTSGEYFGALEEDVVSHLSLREEILRADNYLHYFCGIGNELMESDDEEEAEVPDNAFRMADTSVPGGRNNDTDTHEVVTRTTTSQTEAETKKTKKTKKKETTTSVTTAVKQMTSTEAEEYVWTTTTTTTEEETTTTPITKNTAPDITTKVTTAPTQPPATTKKTKKTTKGTTKATTKATTKETTKETTPSVTEDTADEPQQPEDGGEQGQE